MQQQAFVRLGSGMGQGAEVPHSSTTRAVTMSYWYHSSAVLGASEDISLLPLALNIVRSE
jgi:hypothetical protein